MTSIRNTAAVKVKGHVKIVDDLGNLLLDKTNAIHPQNVARIFARALSHEHNYFINRMAFGNGGTVVNAAFTITYKTPNDGQPPDIATWDSRIYNETYSEIVDAGQDTLNPNLGVDPGSADINTGVRPGGGSVPANDPPSVLHVSGPGVRSNELGLTSEVIITSVLNATEPMGQHTTDSLPPTEPTEGSFVFDEIGLYTSGGPAIATSGYQYVDVGDRVSTDDTGLAPAIQYNFGISVDGGAIVPIQFTTPAAGGSGTTGEILYGDLCQAINTGAISWGMSGISPLPLGTTMKITDVSGLFPTLVGAQTFGFIEFQSPTSGTASSVKLSDVTHGYDIVNVGGNTAGGDPTNLVALTAYTATITIDGIHVQPISVLGSSVTTFGALVTAITAQLGGFGTAALVDGNIRVTSNLLGVTSTVLIVNSGANPLFAAPLNGFVAILSGVPGVAGINTFGLTTGVNPPIYSILVAPVAGKAQGVQNAPTAPTTERERLLAHLIFSPVLKAANRALTITYTLTISIARTPA